MHTAVQLDTGEGMLDAELCLIEQRRYAALLQILCNNLGIS